MQLAIIRIFVRDILRRRTQRADRRARELDADRPSALGHVEDALGELDAIRDSRGVAVAREEDGIVELFRVQIGTSYPSHEVVVEGAALVHPAKNDVATNNPPRGHGASSRAACGRTSAPAWVP